MGLGSGIRKEPIPDPGIKKKADPGSESATLLTGDTPVHKFSHHTGGIPLAQVPTAQRAHCAFSFWFRRTESWFMFTSLAKFPLLVLGAFGDICLLHCVPNYQQLYKEAPGNFRGLHGMGDGRNSLKISAPHPLIKTPLPPVPFP